MEERKKVYLEVFKGKELVNTFNNESGLLLQLLSYCYDKAILKVNSFKIKGNYNYTEYTDVIVNNDLVAYNGEVTKYKYVYHNVPVIQNRLDTNKINDIISARTEMEKNLMEYLKNKIVQNNLGNLCKRLQNDYNGEKEFEQYEEDRIVLCDLLDILQSNQNI